VVEEAVDEIVVDRTDHLSGVRLANGRVVPREVLFVPPRFEPNSAVLAGLGCDRDPDGWVLVDPNGRTTIAGVWAAGNVVDPRAQLISRRSRASSGP